MILVKITCEIKYLERLKILAGYEAIYEDMLKKKPKGAEQWALPGIRIENKEKKQAMLFDSVRSVIDIEQAPNIGFCRDSVIQFFKSVDERLGIPKVARYGLRSTQLQEYKGRFEDLLDKCKKNIFGNSSIVETVDDLGTVFDYYPSEGRKLSITIGPMKIEQLKSQFLSFEPESLPPVFLYVAVDVGDTVTREFSLKYLREFFDMAIKEGESFSTQIIKQVGVA